MLLCLYPPGSMRRPARVLPCPTAVPSTSFRVLTLSRPCPSLSMLRPALVLSALTAGATTSLGSGLGARPTAPAARRGGALGVIGSAPDPAAARASPHRPRPAAIRPCSRPLSGPAAPPHPPPHPASCFPPALPACPGGVPAARPHLPGPRRGGAATRTITPPRTTAAHLVPATHATAVLTHHTPDARVQPATRSPGQDKCPLRYPHSLCDQQVISTQPALDSDLTRSTPEHPLQPAWYIHSSWSHIPGHNPCLFLRK